MSKPRTRPSRKSTSPTSSRKNIAAELILTYPQKHDVELGGTDIGSVKHLPPTLTLQYHFNPTGTVRPYVGLGVNYTRFTSVDLDAGSVLGGSVPLKIDRSSFGLRRRSVPISRLRRSGS
jgi:outer membrane protein